jgi:hypothetical protein
MILSKDVLVNNIVTEISDNSTGQISPYDIRHNLLDIVDSVHLLTIGKPLNGSNFATQATRTTRVGEDAISKIDLAGYFSIDNTALGFSALKANYQSIRNTAIGSHALFCNVYGEHNAALGYSALGGNTVGVGNVGLGNFALNNNKGGNFNIAIGHGAGYYLSNDTSNKLVIASHQVDSDYICDNPLGSGLTPLIYGDLSSAIFGINTRTLHSDGVLQVGGNIAPVTSSLYYLGSSNYAWSRLYLSSGIFFDTNLYIGKQNSSDIQVQGNVLPQSTTTYNLGSYDYLWQSGLFNNIYVSGVATINRFVAFENCSYACKTINLASSGSVSLDGGGADSLYDYYGEESPFVHACGYLQDADLSGAGFNIQASGSGYLRTYSLLFAPPNSGLSCLQTDSPYSRASWNSNISIHLDSGRHLRTDRVIFPSSINIVNSSGCFGLFSRGSGLFFSKSELVSHSQSPSGYLAGVGDINFYATSGDSSDYVINFAVPDSGVVIKQRFLTGIKRKTLDALNNNLDKLNGFEFQYVDDANGLLFGPTSDRLVIGSYNNTSQMVNALSIMKTNQSEGLVGITDLNPNSENTLPETSLNVRSSTNAVGRFTAENNAATKAAIQLLAQSNCLVDGFEAAYLNNSGVADLSIYKDSGREVYIRLHEEGTGVDYRRIGFFSSAYGGVHIPNDDHGMVSIGSVDHDYASISMREYSHTSNPQPNIPTYRPEYRPNRGVYFISPKSKTFQNHTMYMVDGGGNVHDLVINRYDVTDGRGLYTDPSGNTFGGLYCPDRRDDINGAERNTAIGSGALFGITTGDDNTVFGVNSGRAITTGSKNTLVGSNVARNVSTGSNNIVIGNNSFNNTQSSTSYNIIIGNDNLANNSSGNYKLLIGNSGVVLIEGSLGPTNADKYLAIPSGGRLLVNDSTNADAIQLRANYIDILDRSGNNYPDNTLGFMFHGNNSAELLNLNHAANPMTNSPVYANAIPPRPRAQLNGDLRLRGAIRFSDFTSLDSAEFLEDIAVLQSGVNSNTTFINSAFIEGYVSEVINPPNDASSPTTGILTLKNQNWQNTIQVTLVNRDTTLSIHAGAYVVAIRVNQEFRPMWISAKDTQCQCCR